MILYQQTYRIGYSVENFLSSDVDFALETQNFVFAKKVVHYSFPLPVSFFSEETQKSYNFYLTRLVGMKSFVLKI